MLCNTVSTKELYSQHSDYGPYGIHSGSQSLSNGSYGSYTGCDYSQEKLPLSQSTISNCCSQPQSPGGIMHQKFMKKEPLFKKSNSFSRENRDIWNNKQGFAQSVQDYRVLAKENEERSLLKSALGAVSENVQQVTSVVNHLEKEVKASFSKIQEDGETNSNIISDELKKCCEQVAGVNCSAGKLERQVQSLESVVQETVEDIKDVKESLTKKIDSALENLTNDVEKCMNIRFNDVEKCMNIRFNDVEKCMNVRFNDVNDTLQDLSKTNTINFDSTSKQIQTLSSQTQGTIESVEERIIKKMTDFQQQIVDMLHANLSCEQSNSNNLEQRFQRVLDSTISRRVDCSFGDLKCRLQQLQLHITENATTVHSEQRSILERFLRETLLENLNERMYQLQVFIERTLKSQSYITNDSYVRYDYNRSIRNEAAERIPSLSVNTISAISGSCGGQTNVNGSPSVTMIPEHFLAQRNFSLQRNDSSNDEINGISYKSIVQTDRISGPVTNVERAGQQTFVTNSVASNNFPNRCYSLDRNSDIPRRLNNYFSSRHNRTNKTYPPPCNFNSALNSDFSKQVKPSPIALVLPIVQSNVETSKDNERLEERTSEPALNMKFVIPQSGRPSNCIATEPSLISRPRKSKRLEAKQNSKTQPNNISKKLEGQSKSLPLKPLSIGSESINQNTHKKRKRSSLHKTTSSLVKGVKGEHKNINNISNYDNLVIKRRIISSATPSHKTFKHIIDDVTSESDDIFLAPISCNLFAENRRGRRELISATSEDKMIIHHKFNSSVT